MDNYMTAGRLKSILDKWPKDTPIVVSLGNQFFDGEAVWYNVVDCDFHRPNDYGPVLLQIYDEPSMA